MKLAIIGAGSLRTPLLIRGLTTSDLPIREIALFDPDRTRLELMRGLAGHWKGTAELVPYESSEEALRQCDLVFTSIRAGGMEARAKDERACLAYGVLGQETVGPAGFALALRNLPPMVHYARQVERVAPEAFIINFTNPAGLITQGVRQETRAQIIGICDTPLELMASAAEVLSLDISRCRFDTLGLNHLGWLREIYYQDSPQLHRVWSQPELIDRIYRAPLFDPGDICRHQLLPCEYLYSYFRTQDAVDNLKGAQKTRGEALFKMNQAFLKKLASGEEDGAELYDPYLSARDATYFQVETGSKPRAARGGELTGYDGIGVAVARAIHFDSGRVIPLNVLNQGLLPELEPEDVIEVPCRVGRDGAVPLPVAPLPLPELAAELMKQVKHHERLVIRAVSSRKLGDLEEALAAHPLVAGHVLARRLIQVLELGLELEVE